MIGRGRQQVTDCNELWRLTFCSDDTNSSEPYVRNDVAHPASLQPRRDHAVSAVLVETREWTEGFVSKRYI